MNLLALPERGQARLLYGRDMHEDVFRAVIRLNETVTLLPVEPLPVFLLLLRDPDIGSDSGNGYAPRCSPGCRFPNCKEAPSESLKRIVPPGQWSRQEAGVAARPPGTRRLPLLGRRKFVFIVRPSHVPGRVCHKIRTSHQAGDRRISFENSL